jgi:low affinity Fe/Cu permease
MNIGRLFETLSAKCAKFTGSSAGFALALVLVLGWAVTGPYFHYSETWQIVINTTTTIITFLMVFLIQRSQNKDVLALHAKLNELISANAAASNRLINIESLEEQELNKIQEQFVLLKESDEISLQAVNLEAAQAAGD